MLYKVDYSYFNILEYSESIVELVEYDTIEEAEQYGYDRALEILGNDYDNYDVCVIVTPMEVES